tara:strand:- start:1733 stop:2101 length:369 start_codon:yes stop_codon:yes gene_type:complete
MLALLAIRARIAGAPAPAHGPLYEGAVYTGALLGVRARVELGVDRDFAEVALSGLPLGGALRGRASFGEFGEPVLDDALARAMRRRCCAITAVTPSSDGATLRVELALPLFGRRALELRRVE